MVVLACCMGCVNIRVNRTGSDSLWKPFSRGSRYVLCENVFLMRLDGNGVALVPSRQSRRANGDCYEGSGYYSAPESVEAYQATVLSTNWVDVAGVVKAGTLLEPTRLDRYYQFSLWYGFQRATLRYAIILSGEFNGMVADVEDLHWNPTKYLKESREPRH